MRARHRLASLCCVLLSVAPAAACTGPKHASPAQAGPLVLSSPAFAGGGLIPITYGCTGNDQPLPLAWRGAAPQGARAWAVVVADVDVPGMHGAPWLDWTVADIPLTVRSIGSATVPTGASVAPASNGTPGYVGMCPPPGSIHHYRATLYAESATLGDLTRSTASQALARIEQSALASTAISGYFTR